MCLCLARPRPKATRLILKKWLLAAGHEHNGRAVGKFQNLVEIKKQKKGNPALVTHHSFIAFQIFAILVSIDVSIKYTYIFSSLY
jgi:hypothetical protein